MQEGFKSSFKAFGVGLVSRTLWEHQFGSVKFLQSVLEHWSVDFKENVGANFNFAVGSDSENVAVKRSVMDLAKRKTIRDDWKAVVLLVPDDVCRVKQFLVLETTDCALCSISTEDSVSELLLVQTNHCHPSDVLSAGLVGSSWRNARHKRFHILTREMEREARRIIANDHHRPDRGVAASFDPSEVDKRSSGLHCLSEPGVVPMGRVGSVVAIAEESVFAWLVAVGILPTRRDRKRHSPATGRPDSSLANERDTNPLEIKPSLESLPRNDIAVHEG